jgi:signal transduction histidine kinase
MKRNRGDDPVEVRTEFVVDYVMKTRKHGAFILINNTGASKCSKNFEKSIKSENGKDVINVEEVEDVEEVEEYDDGVQDRAHEPTPGSWKNYFIVKLEYSGPSRTRISGGYRRFFNA